MNRGFERFAERGATVTVQGKTSDCSRRIDFQTRSAGHPETLRRLPPIAFDFAFNRTRPRATRRAQITGTRAATACITTVASRGGGIAASSFFGGFALGFSSFPTLTVFGLLAICVGFGGFTLGFRSLPTFAVFG